MLPLILTHQSWRLKAPFIIAHGTVDAVETVTVGLWDGIHTGHGTCRPYACYDETIASVLHQLGNVARQLPQGLTSSTVQSLLPPGAARNALDLALWDLTARQAGKSLAGVLNLPELKPVRTVDATISIAAPDAMAAAATAATGTRLKIKLGGPERDAKLEAARLRAIRAARPGAELLVDANEGWTPAMLQELLPMLAEVRLLLLEQPLPATDDEMLRGLQPPCPIFADESVHDRASLPALAGKYQGINIKLDKTGGLTEALALKAAAQTAGYQIMVGCMVAPSAALVPALLLAQDTDYADLDGAQMLLHDSQPALVYENGFVRV